MENIRDNIPYRKENEHEQREYSFSPDKVAIDQRSRALSGSRSGSDNMKKEHEIENINVVSSKENKNFKEKFPGQNNKKDTVLRMFYKDRENFAEIFNKTVFLRDKIRAEDLQESDSVEVGAVEYLGKEVILHQERDVIKKVCRNKELMLFAIENSTYIDYVIPIKILNYCCVNYNRQVMRIRDDRKKNIKENRELGYKETESEFLSKFRKDDKLNGIITLLIYYGEAEWDGPLSLCDMMELSNEDKDIIADYKILHFIDVMRLTPEQLDEFEGQVKILLGFLRYQKDSNALERFIKENEELMNGVTNLTESAISNMCQIEIESLYKEILNIQGEEQIRNEIEEKYRKEGGLHMNEAFKQIFVRAQNEARKMGYDEGRNENKKEIIINMQNEGLPLDKIAIYTGLSVNEVKNYTK